MNAETTDTGKSDDETLAGEYALGVLSAGERLAVQQRIKNDANFAAIVAAWDDRLQPLSREIAEERVPRRVWSELEGSLFRRDAAPTGLWNSAAFWRWLTAATSLGAAACVALLLLVPPPAGQPPLVAALHAGDAGPTFLAKIDPASGNLVIRVAAGTPQADKVPELWLIPADGVPRSLGVIEKQGETQVAMTAPHIALAAPQTALAISLEPPGGSPTGQPTGPVIAIGKLQLI